MLTFVFVRNRYFDNSVAKDVNNVILWMDKLTTDYAIFVKKLND